MQLWMVFLEKLNLNAATSQDNDGHDSQSEVLLKTFKRIQWNNTYD